VEEDATSTVLKTSWTDCVISLTKVKRKGHLSEKISEVHLSNQKRIVVPLLSRQDAMFL
jgi:hypothetical protein